MTHWHAITNVAGYMPDSDAPADSYATADEARAALRSDLEFARDGLDLAFGLEPDDTRGAAEYDSITAALDALAGSAPGTEFLIYTTDGGRHTLPRAWQVGACNSADCEEPEA